MADNEKELKLVINAYTKGVEAGMKKVQDDLAKLKGSTASWGKDLSIASNALDVRPMKMVNAEVFKLRAEYDRLRKSGKLSQTELAQAAQNLKTKTAELRGQQVQLNSAMQSGQGITSRMAGSVKNLVAAYVGYRAITGIYSTITTAARDAEQAQFSLSASVQAASREFENTGGLDDWQGKITTLSGKLKIYSESDVANAASRTIDMTKRLGMSADQMEVLIQRTGDLSAGKTDLEGGIERVTAALRGEAESAEFLGLTLNEDYIKGWYASNDATGKAWKNLTDLEKAQVRYLVFLEQTEALQGRAADSVKTFNGALQSIQTNIANAIANNEDLAGAMNQVAKVIKDNADEIGDMASELATAIGWVIDFTVNNRELLAVLIGSGGLVYALGKTAGAISAIGGAVDTVSAKKLPEILGSGGAINAALLARIGLYGAMAAGIIAIYSSYSSMRDAQDEAAASQQRLAESEAYAQGVANAAADSTGLQIANIKELNNLIREGTVVRNELTGQYQTAAQAEAEHNAEVQNQIDLNNQRNESFQEIADLAQEMTEKYGDLSAEALNAGAKQQLFDEALTNIKSPLEKAAESVDKLGDAYYDAKTALDLLEEGEAGYQEALDDKLKAEQKYTDAVASLRSAQINALEDQLDNEENALENSLDRRLIGLDEELQDELLTKKEYDYEKAKAEQQHADQVLAIRRRMYDEAAKLYGEDSQQAIDARNDVVAAENDLAKATNTTDQAFDTLHEKIKRTGEEGERSGKRAAKGMRDIGDEAKRSTSAVNELTRAEKEAAESAERRQKREQQFRDGFNGTVITGANAADVLGNKSLSFLNREYSDALTDLGNTRGLFAGQIRANYRSLAQGIQQAAAASVKNSLADATSYEDLQQQVADLTAEVRRTADGTGGVISAGQIAAIADSVAKASGLRQQTKQMTINLKGPSGTSVPITMHENDAGKFLQQLEDAGMVTA